MVGSSRPATCICSRKRTFSSCDHEFWPVTLNLELDPDRIKMNQQAKYLGQRSFRSKVFDRKHTHTRPGVLCGPLKWLIVDNKVRISNKFRFPNLELLYLNLNIGRSMNWTVIMKPKSEKRSGNRTWAARQIRRERAEQWADMREYGGEEAELAARGRRAGTERRGLVTEAGMSTERLFCRSRST